MTFDLSLHNFISFIKSKRSKFVDVIWSFDKWRRCLQAQRSPAYSRISDMRTNESISSFPVNRARHRIYFHRLVRDNIHFNLNTSSSKRQSHLDDDGELCVRSSLDARRRKTENGILKRKNQLTRSAFGHRVIQFCPSDSAAFSQNVYK